jgi:hypothetical protein
MLSVYIHDGPEALRFELAGQLKNGSCQQLEGAWKTAMSIAEGKRKLIGIAGLSSVDADGEALLERLRAEGAQIGERMAEPSAARRCLLGRWLCRQMA